MTTGRKILIAAGVVLVLGTVVAVSVLGKERKKGEEVYMGKAARRDLVSAVSASGQIEPRTKINVQSLVIGQIVKLPVKEGDKVRAGDLLVQVDRAPYQADVDRLEATLRVNRIAIEQQQVALDNARRILRRYRDLGGQGFVSPEALEKTELDVRTGEINIKSLTEQVSQAEAALAKARDELRKTTITSPIDGIVTKLNAELGEMTLTGTMNNPGTVIMVVSDMGAVLAEVDVDETRIVKVKPGETARVVVDAVGELHPYAGRVTEIAGTAVKRQGQEVQVFPVKIALDRPDERLRPGMTAKARIEAEKADGAVTVPIQSVLLKPAKEVERLLASRGDTKDPAGKEKEKKAPSPAPTREGAKGEDEDKREVVFKVVSGKAVLQAVRTGMSDETDVVILEGLAEGDAVVTGPYRAVKKLKDGDLVREKQEKAGEEKEEKAKEKEKDLTSAGGGGESWTS